MTEVNMNGDGDAVARCMADPADEAPPLVPAQRKMLRAEALARQARLLRLEAIKEAREEGRSYGEIGGWIGISKQSISVWFNRARGGEDLRRHRAVG